MPQLVRLFIRNYAIGFVLALIFTGGILAFDIAHLRHLVLNVQGGYLAAFLLFFFSGIVFAGAQTGIAVFLMAEESEPRSPRPPRANVTVQRAEARVPIPVRADDQRRRH